MAENSGRYSYTLSITLITILVILLGFIGEIFKHQARQIRYTINLLLKIGKTFYKTKVNDITANTIKIWASGRHLGYQEGTTKEKGGKEEAKNLLEHGRLTKECTETCLFHLKGTTKLYGILQ